jgi:hypothetical protein
LRRPSLRSPLLAANGLAALLILPLLAQVLANGTDQVSWIRPPTPRSVWAMFKLWSGGSDSLAALELALFALGVARAERGRFALSWFGVPVLGSLIYSLGVAPIAHPKYLIVALPAWLLAVAAGVDQLRSRGLRTGIVLVLSALSVVRLHSWYFDYQKERWREVVTSIASQSRPADVIVLDLFGPEAFTYYVWRLGAAPSMPDPVVPPRAWGFPAPRVTGPDLSTAAAARLAAAPRLWYVQNREQRFEPAHLPLGAKRRLWTRRFEPNDGDAQSLFADSQGRVITLELFAAP